MPYDPHRHVVFIHIPRTGGTSIEAVMDLDDIDGSASLIGIDARGRPLQHLTSAELIEELGDDRWLDCVRFTVIRNPWDRVVSEYHWAHRWEPITFADFVRDIHRRIDAPDEALRDVERRHLWPASRFLTEDDEIEVLRFENLAESWDSFLGLTHVYKQIWDEYPRELPHLSASSKRRGYREYYDDETRAIVEAIYAQDIRFGGYVF